MRLWLALALCALPITGHARDRLVWAGIDYSLVQMVGPGDFNEPDAIFPGYLDKWNDLVRLEQIPAIESRTGRNVDARQAFQIPRSAKVVAAEHLTDAGGSSRTALIGASDVTALVSSYDMGGEGLGLVFVAEQLNKPDQKGCYWVTWFDVASSEVHATDRYCGAAKGFGFRNYWFGTVKDTIAHIKKGKIPRFEPTPERKPVQVAQPQEPTPDPVPPGAVPESAPVEPAPEPETSSE